GVTSSRVELPPVSTSKQITLKGSTGYRTLEEKSECSARCSVAGASVKGSTGPPVGLSVYDPPRKPTPRNVGAAPLSRLGALTGRISSGSTGSFGFATCPFDPER